MKTLYPKLIGIGFIVSGTILNPWFFSYLFEVDAINCFFIFTVLLIELTLFSSGYLVLKQAIDYRSLLLLFCTMILCFLIGEFSLQTFYHFKNKIAPPSRNSTSYLGWITAADQIKEYHISGYGKINYSTQRDGFRVFGDLDTKNKKVFVIGDSFTQAEHISDRHAYYHLLAEANPELEFFVFGCSGYSTLQEFMILEKYFNLIKPDLMIWQFSPNDFINNSVTLESKSFLNNNLMTRPYLINNDIQWKFPNRDHGICHRIVKKSYLCKLLNLQFNSIKRKNQISIEDELHPKHPLLIESINVTNLIFAKARIIINDTPVYAFDTGHFPKWSQYSFQKVCKENEFIIVPDIPVLINKAHDKGYKVDYRPIDYHWTRLGHQIAAKEINRILQQQSDLKSAQTFFQ